VNKKTAVKGLALLLQRQFSFDHFLTHDRQLGLAARALGFDVVGIS
jgi:hypothetical protein